MINIPRLVAMETLLENIAGQMVIDVKTGDLPMHDKVLGALETIVEAARQTQVVREMMEAQAAAPEQMRFAS